MNGTPTTNIARLLAAWEGARDALASDGAGVGPLGDVLTRLSGPELAEFMRLADDVKARAGAAQIRVTAEAAHRGEFTSARRGVGSVHGWVREHAPSLRQDGAGQLAHLAQDVACSVPGGLWSTAGPRAGAYADLDKPEGVVWARVITGEVGPSLALTALKEMAKFGDQLQPEAVPTVTGAILDHGVKWGCADARRLRPHLLAMFGAEGELDDAHKRLRKAAYLTNPRVNDADITEYRLGLTPAQAATVEAAIGPLSQPAPNDVTGERDLRPAEQRRAEALASVCTRVSSEEAAAKPSPGGASTTLHVAMTLDDLKDKLHAHDGETRTRPTTAQAGVGGSWCPGRKPRSWRLRSCGSWRVTPTSSRSSWAPMERSSTSVAGSGCSPVDSDGPCGTATRPAPTPGATCPPGGFRHITSSTGSTGTLGPGQRRAAVSTPPHAGP